MNLYTQNFYTILKATPSLRAEMEYAAVIAESAQQVQDWLESRIRIKLYSMIDLDAMVMNLAFTGFDQIQWFAIADDLYERAHWKELSS